jgi:hypothetical protein
MVTAPTLLGVETRWSCPNCTATAVTREPRPHTQFHACGGLGGLTAPLVVDGTRCKIEAVAREDYLHGDIPQRDQDGRVVMAVVTTRDDGQDCAVLAPTATGSREDAL